jgi:hypothetical protein
MSRDPLEAEIVVVPEAVARAIRGAREYSAEEDALHAAHLGQTLAIGTSRTRAFESFRAKFPDVSRARFDEVWERIATGLTADFDKNKPHAKALQALRLERELGQAIKTGKLNTAVRIEALLADIYGTRAPSEVNVNARVSGAFVGMMATMPDEQVKGMLARARERRLLAERAEDAGLGENVDPLDKP